MVELRGVGEVRIWGGQVRGGGGEGWLMEVGREGEVLLM